MPVKGHGIEYVDLNDVSRTLCVLGFYVSVIGLASYTIKERLYMSEPLIALLFGVATGPIAWALLDPYDWTGRDIELTSEYSQFAECEVSADGNLL